MGFVIKVHNVQLAGRRAASSCSALQMPRFLVVS